MLVDTVFPPRGSNNSSCSTIRRKEAEMMPASFFNRDIEKNVEQQHAIANILSSSDDGTNGCYSTPPPYIIFGPPGTGKTVTVVESIKQVRTRHYI